MRPRCGLCGRRCVPLADFDEPTCLHCEQTRIVAIAAEEHRNRSIVAGGTPAQLPRLESA
jgi:hypothetical protein